VQSPLLVERLYTCVFDRSGSLESTTIRREQ
jgi:hypothetical protein